MIPSLLSLLQSLPPGDNQAVAVTKDESATSAGLIYCGYHGDHYCKCRI